VSRMWTPTELWLAARKFPPALSSGEQVSLLLPRAGGFVAPVRNLFGIKSRRPMLMPGVAQPAIQEGKYVADVIRRRVAGRPRPETFWYWDKGDLAIVGRTYAIADLRFSRFAGFIGWLLWAGVHIYFLIGFANRLFVLLQWGFDFVTKRRRVRVLSEEPPSAQNMVDPAA